MQTICLIGASGRMGRAIQALLPTHVQTFLFTRLSLENQQILFDSSQKSDVVIDFSNPENLEFAVASCLQNQIPYLCGTTGLDPQHFELLQNASAKIPVLYAANTSLGIAILKKAVALVAKSLGANTDITISETHHNLKKDAPSGTALALGEVITHAIKNPPQISYSSLRGGNVVGEHTVHFFHKDEIIHLSHECLNRNVFADGAIKAATWIVKQQPGFYSLDDLLELK
jgi:4-hydroxy-tetrahydrodipicolinate reductase